MSERVLGVLSKKGNGTIVLESTKKGKKKFPFICEISNDPAVQRTDSGNSRTSIDIPINLTHVTDSFNAWIIIIPTSLLGLIILVSLIICTILRLKKTKNKEKMTTERPKDDVALRIVKRNDNVEPDEYDVLRQQRETTHNNDLYNHAKGQSSGIYEVTIRDQSLLHDKTITDNLYDIRIKTAVKHDERYINLYDVTIRDQSLFHDNTVTYNLYDRRTKTAVKHDELDINLYDVTIRDQSLLHDNTITDNLYDSSIKTAVKQDERDINLYDDSKRSGRDTYDNPTKLSIVTQLTDNVYGQVNEN